HAGLQFRAHREVAEKTPKMTYYIRPDGKGQLGEFINPDNKTARTRQDAPQDEPFRNLPWKAMSFVVNGNRYTCVYLDHPDNPKPSLYAERDYGRFGSNFHADILPDKPVVCRYRLWIQEG